MIKGVGVDILSTSKFQRTMSYNPDNFINRVYSYSEINQANKRKNPFKFYASRFAAKEAVFKCLNIESDYIDLSQISVESLSNGNTTVVLENELKKKAKENGITQILLSISYETDYIIAFAMAI